MANFQFPLSQGVATEATQDDIVCVRGVYFTLRRHEDGEFYADAPFPAYGDVVLPAVEVPALTSLFSLEVEDRFETGSDGEELGSTRWQITTDGETYWYWDADAEEWTEGADLSVGSTWVELDENLPTLAIAAEKKIGLRFRILSDADLTSSPEVHKVGFSCELNAYDRAHAVESVVAFVEDNLGARLTCSVTLTSSEAEFVLPAAFTVRGVDAVYNLTADPKRKTNLLDDYDADTKKVAVVDLIEGTVDEPIELEVQYRGYTGVTPGAREEELDDAAIPFIGMIPLVMPRDDREGNRVEISFSKGRNRVRERPAPDTVDILCRFYCMAERKLEATLLADALGELFDSLKVPFLPTGEQMGLVSIQHYQDNDNEARGLPCKRVTVTLRFHKHSRTYTESAATTEIIMRVASNGIRTESFSVIP